MTKESQSEIPHIIHSFVQLVLLLLLFIHKRRCLSCLFYDIQEHEKQTIFEYINNTKKYANKSNNNNKQQQQEIYKKNKNFNANKSTHL